MQFSTIHHNDLEHIRRLRPEGWSDLVPVFNFYVESNFCFPIKTEIQGNIAGVGAVMLFERTAWMAHVIVSEKHRNKGIGYAIVSELLQYVKSRSVNTCLLIATPLGESIYTKAGFRPVMPYTFLERTKPRGPFPVSENIVPFHEHYRDQLLKLDREVSGENREQLLSDHLQRAQLYLEHDCVKGFYMPGLWEGPIIADTAIAGVALMKLKYTSENRAVLPLNNTAGISFLTQNGFTATAKKGIRMIYGDAIFWKPGKIYSRIGGNFG